MIFSKKSSLILLCLTLGTFTFGVLGYSYIEGWGLFDSVYMTVITITTTGYQELHPLSPEGRLFTIFLLILGFGVVAYSASHFMQDFFSIDFKARRRIAMDKKIESLSDHIIVCGYGRIGQVIAKRLHDLNEKFVVIESNPDALENLEHSGFYWIDGDATDDNSLMRAGIERAKTLAAMVDDDADSLYISLAGRALNENLNIIARATNEAAKKKILRAGANRVILPLLVSGLKVAQSIVNPEVDDLIDIKGFEATGDNRVQIAEIEVDRDSLLHDESLKTIGMKLKKVLVVGVRHVDETFSFVPDPDYRFQAGDTLVTISTTERFNQVFEKLK